MTTNWRTTASGILSIVMAVGGLALAWLSGHPIGQTELAAAGTALSAGVGLLAAADASKK